jgi:hypothetical protein
MFMVTTAVAGIVGEVMGTLTVNGMSLVHVDPLVPHDLTCRVWLPPAAEMLAAREVPL